MSNCWPRRILRRCLSDVIYTFYSCIICTAVFVDSFLHDARPWTRSRCFSLGAFDVSAFAILLQTNKPNLTRVLYPTCLERRFKVNGIVRDKLCLLHLS